MRVMFWIDSFFFWTWRWGCLIQWCVNYLQIAWNERMMKMMELFSMFLFAPPAPTRTIQFSNQTLKSKNSFRKTFSFAHRCGNCLEKNQFNCRFEHPPFTWLSTPTARKRFTKQKYTISLKTKTHWPCTCGRESVQFGSIFIIWP